MVTAIVQARIGSTRLPGKVLWRIGGRTVIDLLLHRLSHADLVDQIVVAVPEGDALLIDHVCGLGYSVFRGSEEDVLGRYHGALNHFGGDTIVRITGDCPLVDPDLIDEAIEVFFREDADYLSNFIVRTYPKGLGVEVFRAATLERAYRETDDPYDREHVTPYMYNSGLFETYGIENDKDHSDKRWTLDYMEDFIVIRSAFQHFAPNIDFTWKDVLALQEQQPELFRPNKERER